ncbi:hypothetical protein Tcur_0742 [Thermomonospora curvata DSM 43183]|uniref:Uncharacterized protein n=2 Tax=Thermomonosporaceae TaxID=2012 RepID=D1A5H5_THECD|nr:hypothetical protein Tcur_0742 [Thermomonospora curvata DSM 43183]
MWGMNDHMGTTATDYLWFDEQFRGDLAEAYCFTVALRLTPEEYLRRLSAEITERRRGVTGLYDLALNLEGDIDDNTDGKFSSTRLLVAATYCEGADGSAVLAVEPNGYLGVREDVMSSVSKGTRTVSWYRNIEWLSDFLWMEDGQKQLGFDPYRPYERWGTTPDALVAQMEEVGFDLNSQGKDDEERGPYNAAAFALAERLTGVRVTPELLNESTFLCGIAPIP